MILLQKLKEIKSQLIDGKRYSLETINNLLPNKELIEDNKFLKDLANRVLIELKSNYHYHDSLLVLSLDDTINNIL